LDEIEINTVKNEITMELNRVDTDEKNMPHSIRPFIEDLSLFEKRNFMGFRFLVNNQCAEVITFQWKAIPLQRPKAYKV
jgi:hypothetical protein